MKIYCFIIISILNILCSEESKFERLMNTVLELQIKAKAIHTWLSNIIMTEEEKQDNQKKEYFAKCRKAIFSTDLAAIEAYYEELYNDGEITGIQKCNKNSRVKGSYLHSISCKEPCRHIFSLNIE